MNRNLLYVVIALLVVGIAVVGYQLYKERQEPSGVEIKIGEGGVSIKSN